MDKNQRLRRKPEYVPDDPLLTATQSAAERGQAISMRIPTKAATHYNLIAATIPI
jgi:hypothetical protein